MRELCILQIVLLRLVELPSFPLRTGKVTPLLITSVALGIAVNVVHTDAKGREVVLFALILAKIVVNLTVREETAEGQIRSVLKAGFELNCIQYVYRSMQGFFLWRFSSQSLTLWRLRFDTPVNSRGAEALLFGVFISQSKPTLSWTIMLSKCLCEDSYVVQNDGSQSPHLTTIQHPPPIIPFDQIKQRSQFAVAFGGFSDVYLGHLEDTKVHESFFVSGSRA